MTNRDDLPAPTDGLVLTQFLTVRDVAVSRDFYTEVLRGQIVRTRTPPSSRSRTVGSS